MKAVTKSRLKNFGRIFLLSLGIVIGACAVIMLALFAFGAFKKPDIPLESMHFKVNGEYNEQNVYFIDEDCEIMVVPTPNDSTDINLTIKIQNETNESKDVVTIKNTVLQVNRILTLSVEKEELQIGEETVGVNRGGVVEITAESKEQLVSCSCTIFVDTIVEAYETKLEYAVNKSGQIKFYDAIYNEETNSLEYYDSQSNLVEIPLYKGVEFYVTISKVYPSNSLTTYSRLLATKACKTFTVESSNIEYASVSPTEYSFGMPKAKVTINETGSFSISSSLINSYNNIIRAKEVEEQLANGLIPSKDVDPDAYAELYTNKINEYTEYSETYNFVSKELEVNEIEVETSKLNLTLNESYEFNSKAKSAQNENGLGIKLISKLNTDITENNLNNLLVKTGYKASNDETQFETINEEKIVLSEDYIKVTKNIKDSALILTIDVLKIKSGNLQKHYLILSIDNVNALIEITLNDIEYPEFQISLDSNNITETLLKDGDNFEKLDLVNYKFFDTSTLSQIDTEKYAILYMISMDSNDYSVNTDCDIIENANGVIEGVLTPDENGVNESYHIYVSPLKIGKVYIRAYLIRKDFNGNLIENNGGYVYAQVSSNYIEVNIEEKFEITGVSVLAKINNDFVPAENLTADSENTNGISYEEQVANKKLVKIYEGEPIDIYFTILANDYGKLNDNFTKGKLGLFVDARYQNQNISVGDTLDYITTINNEPYYGFVINTIRYISEEIPVTMLLTDENGDPVKTETINFKILSTDLEEISLSSENASSGVINANATIDLGSTDLYKWLDKNQQQIGITFEFSPSRFVFDYRNLIFKYSLDNNTWQDYDELTTKIVKLSIDENLNVTTEYKNVGTIYVKAEYVVSGETIKSSSVITFNITADDLKLEGSTEIDKYNVMTDVTDNGVTTKQQNINLLNENIYKLYKGTSLINNGWKLLNFEILTVNGNAPDNNFTIIRNGDNCVLNVTKQYATKQVIEIKITSIFGTNVGEDSGVYILALNLLPNIKVTAINNAITVITEDLRYSFNVQNNSAINVKEYFEIVYFEDEDGSTTQSYPLDTNVVYSEDITYVSFKNIANDDVELTFTNSGVSSKQVTVYIEPFEGYIITINVTILNY